MEKLAKLKELIAAAEAEGSKFFESGNNAAGTRLRNALQEIKTVAQELRNDVTAKKNEAK